MRSTLLLNLVLGLGVLAMPRFASAQAGGIVEGRIYERSTDLGIQGAVVELRGHGASLTASDGSFRFEDVQPGGYSLRVMAFGYSPHDEFIVVRDNTVLDIPLDPAAIALDSITVNIRGIDISGRVRDPEKDFLLVGAEVLTNQGRASETNAHGRFELESVIEGAPLQVSIRAFGYLPLDTTILAREDAEYLFDLKADPVVQAMVSVQVERLEERASPRFAALYRNLNRDQLLRYSDGHSLFSALMFEYGPRRLDRVQCVLIDEVVYTVGPDVRMMLDHMFPEEVQRVEFMFSGGMLRVYTREFMQQMIARHVELRTPIMVGGICR